MWLVLPLLALAAPAWAGGGCDAPEDLRVVVFTDAPDTGDAVLADLAAAGFSSPDNLRQGVPGTAFAITWGCADEAVVHSLAEVVEARVGHPLALARELDASDRDVFVNLPMRYGASLRGSTVAEQLRSGAGCGPQGLSVEVATPHADLGTQLLADLHGVGFTNPDNRTVPAQGGDYAIHWGCASVVMVQVAHQLVAERVGRGLVLTRDLAHDDPTLRIEVPVEADAELALPVVADALPVPASGQVVLWCDDPSGAACGAAATALETAHTPAPRLSSALLASLPPCACDTERVPPVTGALEQALGIDAGHWHGNRGNAVDLADATTGPGCTNCCWEPSEATVKIHATQGGALLVRVWEAGD